MTKNRLSETPDYRKQMTAWYYTHSFLHSGMLSHVTNNFFHMNFSFTGYLNPFTQSKQKKKYICHVCICSKLITYYKYISLHQGGGAGMSFSIPLIKLCNNKTLEQWENIRTLTSTQCFLRIRFILPASLYLNLHASDQITEVKSDTHSQQIPFTRFIAIII